jgi:hypothetical protein
MTVRELSGDQSLTRAQIAETQVFIIRTTVTNAVLKNKAHAHTRAA